MDDTNWTDRPPDTKSQPALTLKRTGPTKTVGICLSNKPIGTLVHFWRGRTRPCLGPLLCEACHDGQTRRWKGYLALYNPDERKVWIHEFTENAYGGIGEALESFTSLRGHWIRFERTKPVSNAPVVATVSPSKSPSDTIPEDPDIKQVLNRIWDLEDQLTTAPETSPTEVKELRPALYPRGNGQPRAVK